MNDAYAPLRLLADVFRLDPGLIRHWRYRGWIDAAGERQHVRVKGRMYHGEDVMRAERDTFNNSRSHRERDYTHLAAWTGRIRLTSARGEVTMDVSVPADRLADLERIAEAAATWLRCWELAQSTAKTLTAFESSKRLAAVVRSSA